ncbi:MAG: Crp/Fnr family transcriptional regulator [Planctomycetota bacterium]|jgi:CRP-like cAMP-binding protein
MVAAQSLEQDSFFGSLEPSERELLAPIAERRTYEAGETIFEEGENVGTLRTLVSGMVSFRQRHREQTGDVLIGTLQDPGAAFGITSIVARGEPSPHSAVCVEDAEVIEIDGGKLLELCEQKPAVGVHLLLKLSSVMAERLTAAREQIRSRIRPGLISHG